MLLLQKTNVLTLYNSKSTILHLLIKNKYLKIIRTLLISLQASFCNIDVQDFNKRISIYFTIAIKYTNIIRLFIKIEENYIIKDCDDIRVYY